MIPVVALPVERERRHSTARSPAGGYPVRNFDERVAKWIKRIAQAIKAG